MREQPLKLDRGRIWFMANVRGEAPPGGVFAGASIVKCMWMRAFELMLRFS